MWLLCWLDDDYSNTSAGRLAIDMPCAVQTLTAPSDEAVNPEALVRTFFRTEIGTPFSNGGQHDTEESLREFMRALEADMVTFFPLCDLIKLSCLILDPGIRFVVDAIVIKKRMTSWESCHNIFRLHATWQSFIGVRIPTSASCW